MATIQWIIVSYVRLIRDISNGLNRINLSFLIVATVCNGSTIVTGDRFIEVYCNLSKFYNDMATHTDCALAAVTDDWIIVICFQKPTFKNQFCEHVIYVPSFIPQQIWPKWEWSYYLSPCRSDTNENGPIIYHLADLIQMVMEEKCCTEKNVNKH